MIAATFDAPELVILLVIGAVVATPILIVVLILRSAKQRSLTQSPAVSPLPGSGAPGHEPSTGQWAADPFGRHQWRFYDGTSWTEHVMDASTPSIDPPQPQ